MPILRKRPLSGSERQSEKPPIIRSLHPVAEIALLPCLSSTPISRGSSGPGGRIPMRSVGPGMPAPNVRAPAHSIRRN